MACKNDRFYDMDKNWEEEKKSKRNWKTFSLSIFFNFKYKSCIPKSRKQEEMYFKNDEQKKAAATLQLSVDINKQIRKKFHPFEWMIFSAFCWCCCWWLRRWWWWWSWFAFHFCTHTYTKKASAIYVMAAIYRSPLIAK